MVEKQRKTIDLNNDVVEQLQKEADSAKRNLKNHMEFILHSHALKLYKKSNGAILSSPNNISSTTKKGSLKDSA